MKFLSEIFQDIDKYINIFSLILSLIIPFAAWYAYKYRYKYKYKSIKSRNNITRILKDAIITILFFPILSICIQIFIIIILKNIFDIEDFMESYILLFSQIPIALLTLFIIYKTIKNYITEFKRMNLRGIKCMKVAVLYLVSIFTGLFSVFSSFILLLISYIIIISGLSGGDEWIEFSPMYIQVILIWLLGIVGIYYNIKTSLIEDVKRINIHYSKDEIYMKALDIKYEDFYIDKKFISFYKGDNIKTITLIPIENLLKIEYIYDDTIETFKNMVYNKKN